MTSLSYQSGFGNHFASEAIANALPKDQNNPQQVPYGLYAEQISGSAFTMDRKNNQRTWFYRIQPSVVQSEFQPVNLPHWLSPPLQNVPSPNQMRWQAPSYPAKSLDFLHSMITYAAHGDINSRVGAAIHLYCATADMENLYSYNADGDLLIVPQEGDLLIKTECGDLLVSPNEIAVIPRGFKWQIKLPDGKARGYVCENFGMPFELPNLGPLGPNCLAQPRFFLAPNACYEEKTTHCQLIAKYHGHFWQSELDHSPLDVVAWHGNYTPYKYDLTTFTTVNAVTFDHPDPSIFTVLTSQSPVAGTANLDFVIFPERWVVMENTMRLPYFHRNTMSEFMGLIKGNYDAKKGGFVPGGASLHNCMSPHGPDADTYQQAINSDLKPDYYKDTLAFMFESYYPWQTTEFADTTPLREKNYLQCWQSLTAQFSG